MRPTLALALLSAVVGCASAPRGPHAAYRDGAVPVAPPVGREGWYQLRASGTVVALEHVEKGQPLGFAEASPGKVVAVAPGARLPLDPKGYEWIAFSETNPPWRERVQKEMIESLHALGDAVVVTGAFLGMGVGYIAYSFAGGR